MRLKLGVIHFGFALTGIVTTMLGPLLPLLINQWHLDDARAARFFVVQFVASPVGSILASKILSRWGAAWTVPIGMFLIAAGVCTVAAGTLASCMIGIGLYGLGLGFALPSTNLLMVELVSEGQAAALNILNFMWTVGALATPFAIATLVKPIGLRGLLLLLGAVVLLVAVVEGFSFPKGNIVSPSTRHGKIAPSSRFTFAIVTLIFLCLYIGIENGFGGWVPTFSIRSQHTTENMTAFVNASFWGALLAGRLLAPITLRLMREGTLIISGLFVSSIGMVLAIVSPSIAILEAGVLLGGFGMAAIFPTAMAVFAEWYGTGGTGSIVLGCCGLGGALIPWLVGEVSTRSQNLRLGLGVNIACAAIACLLYWAMMGITVRQQNRTAVAR